MKFAMVPLSFYASLSEAAVASAVCGSSLLQVGRIHVNANGSGTEAAHAHAGSSSVVTATKLLGHCNNTYSAAWVWDDWGHGPKGERKQLFALDSSLLQNSKYSEGYCGPLNCSLLDKVVNTNHSDELDLTSLFLKFSPGRRNRVFHRVRLQETTPYTGVIHQPETCKTWHNDGCAAFSGSAFQSLIEQSNMVPINVRSMFPSRVTEANDVITIAHHFQTNAYHSPIDSISSLVNVPPAILRDSSAVVHIRKKTNYTLEWLEIVGVENNRTVEGDVQASRLFVPERPFCTGPSTAQLYWLQGKVWENIGVPDIAALDLLLVVKRKSRGILNHDLVVQLARAYASLHGLQVHVHDDEHLPNVREQLKLFARSAVILAPHGAGLTMTVATAPGACVVEMFPKVWTASVFARQAHILRLNYVGIALHGNDTIDAMRDNIRADRMVDRAELSAALDKCSASSGL